MPVDPGPLRFGPDVVVPTTQPCHGATLLQFLRAFAVPGTEVHDADEGRLRCTRTLRLAHGPALVRLSWTGAGLLLAYAGPASDAEEAATRVRALVDADAPAAALDARLATDSHLAELAASAPGLRIPGALDPAELALQALVGQQVSVAAARRCAEKLTLRYGDRVPGADSPDLPGWLFPTPAALAEADPEELPMPRARGRALVGLAAALAEGSLVLDRAAPWAETRAALLARPGIGPWTADYIGLRALGQPDILLSSDLVIRRELVARDVRDPSAWAPYRSYATLHLWRAYV